jgi:hypothetical protein
LNYKNPVHTLPEMFLFWPEQAYVMRFFETCLKRKLNGTQVRYKECLSYQQYISICDPKNGMQEWIDKIKYLLYIVRLKL